MAIANRTRAEISTYFTAAVNSTKALEVYLAESRNPALAAGVDTALAALKVQLDLTVADVTAAADNPNPVSV